MPQGKVGAPTKVSVTRADLDCMVRSILEEWASGAADPFGFEALLLRMQRGAEETPEVFPSSPALKRGAVDATPALRAAGAPPSLLELDPKVAIGMFHTFLRRLDNATPGACIDICNFCVGFTVGRAVCLEKSMFGTPIVVSNTSTTEILHYSRRCGYGMFSSSLDARSKLAYKLRGIRGGLEFYHSETKQIRTQVFFRSIRGVALPISLREFGDKMVTTYVIPDGLMTIAEDGGVAINGEPQPASITCEDHIVRVAVCGKAYKIADNAAIPD